MYLPLWIIIGKSMLPPPKWIVGRVGGGHVWGVPVRGVPVGGYVLAVVVGCCVGLCWNFGED